MFCIAALGFDIMVKHAFYANSIATLVVTLHSIYMTVRHTAISSSQYVIMQKITFYV